MLEHHLQKSILHKLVAAQTARYSELKPQEVEGNVFTYHLHQLIKQGLVEKCEDGSYCLTAHGKAAGINSKLKESALLAQAHSILLLAIRDTDGRWLVRQRLVQPMYGRVGFLHGEPVAGEPVTVTATRRLKDKTGLEATCQPIGGGYIHLYNGQEVESFTHFTLLTGTVNDGKCTDSDETGRNFWSQTNELGNYEYIPGMVELARQAEAGKPFFTELNFQITF